MEVQKTTLLDRVEEILISVFLGVATLLVFAQVVARYGFNSGFTWASELVEDLFLWTVMIGASYGVKHGVHLGVDILVAKLPSRIRRLVILGAIGISIIFCAGMCYLAFFYVLETHRMGVITVDLQIPQWIPLLALPIGFAMITLRFVQVGWQVASGKRETITQSNEPASSCEEIIIAE